MRKKMLIIFVVAAVCLIGLIVFFKRESDTQSDNPSTKQNNRTQQAQAPSFDKHQYSTSDPNSIWVVVNKQHPLSPRSYVPNDLTIPKVPLRFPGDESMQVRQVTAAALEQMFVAAKKQGLNLMLGSGYRSFTYQTNLYNGYVRTQGRATADTQSARPGYSEHQTGFAADIEPTSHTCEIEQCFADTPEGEWLAASAYKYGFIIRYTTAKEAITGYENEPWHIRYVGTALSQELHRTSIITLEEFFGITGGTTYN